MGWIKFGDFESAQAALKKPRPCRKYRHADQASALVHLRSLLEKESVLRGDQLNVFKCEYCKAWHVGRQQA